MPAVIRQNSPRDYVREWRSRRACSPPVRSRLPCESRARITKEAGAFSGAIFRASPNASEREAAQVEGIT